MPSPGGVSHSQSGSTDEDIAYILDAYRDVLPILGKAVEEGTVEQSLRGQPVQPIARRTGDFDTKPKT